MTEAELTEYRNRINAKWAALNTVVIALIRSHPDQKALLAEIDRANEAANVYWLNTPLPEVFLDQYARDLEALRKHIPPL